MPKDVVMRTCSNCFFCDRKKEKALACRRFPPQAYVIPWPGKLAGSVTIRTIFTVSRVEPNGWCGCHMMPHEIKDSWEVRLPDAN